MSTRILTFIIVLCTASVAARAQDVYTNEFSADHIVPNSAGWSYWFIPTGGAADSLNVKMTCVTTGEWLHGAHVHNHDELYVLVEGEAVVTLNGEDRAFSPGDGLYCPSGSSHSIRRADLGKPLSYLMINRITPEGIKEPFPFFKEDYSVSDCYSSFVRNKSFWLVKPCQTLEGLNVRSVYARGRRIREYQSDGRQIVLIILEGSAEVCAFAPDGSSSGIPEHLSALSVCHIPKGFSCTLKPSSGPLRYLEVRNN